MYSSSARKEWQEVKTSRKCRKRLLKTFLFTLWCNKLYGYFFRMIFFRCYMMSQESAVVWSRSHCLVSAHSAQWKGTNKQWSKNNSCAEICLDMPGKIIKIMVLCGKPTGLTVQLTLLRPSICIFFLIYLLQFWRLSVRQLFNVSCFVIETLSKTTVRFDIDFRIHWLFWDIWVRLTTCSVILVLQLALILWTVNVYG